MNTITTPNGNGWNNTDGGVRTSPTWGGFPGGGQWAVVTL